MLPLCSQFHQIHLLTCYYSAMVLFGSTTSVCLQTKGFILTPLLGLPSCLLWLSWISPPSGPHWTRPAPLTVLTHHRTLSRPPPPGLIGLHLQVSTPHCNTFSPPTILVLLPSTPSLLCYRASRSVTLLVFSMFKHFSFLKFLQLLFMFPVSIHVLVWVHIFCE